MKLSPIITALIVSTCIYLFVMEREALLAFAGVEEQNETETTELQEALDAVPVQVLRSVEAPFQSAVLLRGRTEAFRTVNVSAEISGNVISTPLRKGRQVAKGETLCELDPGTLEAELAEAKAQLAEATANNNVASSLVESGFASETTVIARQASLESAQANVRRAEKNLERLVIKAPFDGILETDTAELGALLQPGSPCATLISLNPIKLVGFATEEQVSDIRVGAAAQARLITGEQMIGQIEFVSRSSDPQTRTFLVEITAPNEDLAIRDGMTAEIQIQLPDQNGHFLPLSSLTLNDAGVLGVRVVREDVARFVPVNMLNETQDGVWMIGLESEELVIVVGQEYVNDGRAVVPTEIESGL